MATIFQKTFSNAFSWMKMCKSRLWFHWSWFPRVQLTMFQHWFRWWLVTWMVTSHYLNQCWSIVNLNQWWWDYKCIYVSITLNELKLFCSTMFFSLASVAPGLSYNCPSVGEVILKDMSIIDQWKDNARLCETPTYCCLSNAAWWHQWWWKTSSSTGSTSEKRVQHYPAVDISSELDIRTTMKQKSPWIPYK